MTGNDKSVLIYALASIEFVVPRTINSGLLLTPELWGILQKD